MTSPYDWPEALRAALLATGATAESADRHAARLADDRLAPMPDDTAPAKHCARLGNHDPHPWTSRVWPNTFYMCPGHVTTEGGQPCATCQRPVAACRCEIERAEARDAEWWA